MGKGTTIAATALIALGVSATGARASAPSAKCKKAARHGKVIAKGPKAFVFELTHAPRILEDYFYGCHYATGRVYRLPDQDGGDTLHPADYVFNGDLLAYTVVDTEPAGYSAYEQIELVDLRRRRLLADAAAFSPADGDPDAGIGASSAPSLLVDARGYVAWIGEYQRRGKTSRNVQVAGSGLKARILDSGEGIARTSLRLSRDRATLSWKKDGAKHSAPFPPAPTAGSSGGPVG